MIRCRALRLVSAASAAVALLSGCTSSATPTARSTPPASSQTVTVTKTPSAASSDTASATRSSARSTSATPSRTSSPTADGPPKNCTDAQLKVTDKTIGGAASHSGLIIVFTNDSNRTCSLYGYPGAADLDAQGRQIAQAERTREGFQASCHCTHPHRITLQPSQAASGAVEGDTGGGNECLRGRAVLVTPPNTTRSTKFTFTAYSCDFAVHPVVAGTHGGVPR